MVITAVLGWIFLGLAFVGFLWLARDAWRRREGANVRPAALALLGLVGAALMLWTALLGDDFRLTYVAGHSERALAPAYKVAAFWAGQEGSVLLWALLTALIAWRLSVSAEARERAASAPVAAVGAGLLLLLFLHSPFATQLSEGDGLGLNPLLENPWMVIHPPVLFVGYALLVVPFALGLVALRDGDATGWLQPARRYLLLGWVALGAGMMLGGYWAYITLGWGGFWAWDPVENSSLIPWVLATAMLHGVLIQQRCGACARANHLLALATFATTIYGSYLTRSGALAGASVHSFESLGAGYNTAWLALLFAPIATYAWHLRRLPRRDGRVEVPATQTWLVNGLWVIIAMAVLILAGTSKPLVGQLTGNPGAVDVSFYNQTQTVLFIAVAATLILQLGAGKLPLTMALAACAALGAFGAKAYLPGDMADSPRMGLSLLAAAAAAMVALGVHRAWVSGRSGTARGVGAGLAHAGVALMVLGAVFSGPGQRVTSASLAPGESVDVLGAHVTLASVEPFGEGGLKLTYTVDGTSGVATMRPSDNGDMRTPAVIARAWGDVYVEPVSLEQPSNTLVLRKGEAQPYGDGELKFIGFEMGGGHGGEGTVSVGAKIELTRDGKTESITPTMIVGGGSTDSPPVHAGDGHLALTSVMPDEGAVELTVRQESAEASPSQQKVAAQVSRKPHIGWVWLGTIVCLAGGAWGLRGPARRKPSSETQ